ncbi:Smr/MutS family protein [Mycoplasmatota bacterium]|nr:Smr/MutS family protein [Mycoplasmatota bacterium]
MKSIFNNGDTVLVKIYNITGVIVEKVNDREYRVERKNQSFIVDKKQLEIVKRNTKYDQIKVEEQYDPLDNVYEIDLHGYTKYEALKDVAYVIENVSMHQFPIIKITHGKGKGILRMAIHDLLKEYKITGLIKSYEYAQDYKGGYGVTIVYII